MDAKTYVREIEKLIAKQQEIQMNNPPSSPQWKNASKEIHRLGKIRLSFAITRRKKCAYRKV